MYKRMLLAYDGSREGRVALKQGAELAQMAQGEVCLLAVLKFPAGMSMAMGVIPEGFLSDEQKHVDEVLAEGAQHLRERGISVQPRSVYGEPIEKIIEAAKQFHADLIVLGHRPRSAMARWWQGSVSMSLLDHVPCSLLIAMGE